MASTTVTPPSAPATRRPGPVRGALEEAGELTSFSARSLRALLFTPRYASEVLRQAALMIRGTWFLLLMMCGFCGMSAMNFGYFFLRAIGASDYTGLIIGYAGPRQIAETLFGYTFTAKVCTGMAAEIGAMKINEEIDAYDSTGIDPLRYVVGTRIMAVIVFVPVGVAISLIGVVLGSWFEAVVVLHGVSAHLFFDVAWSVQTTTDQIYAVITIGTIAVVTALVACFYGLRAGGGPAGVGAVSARSLVVNLVLVHIIAATFAVAFYGTNIHMPIGG
jgi:phospholipid/cholesterol/gamma-HCH transport system permease protein